MNGGEREDAYRLDTPLQNMAGFSHDEGRL